MEYMEGQMQREIERGMMEDDPKATIYIQFSDTGTIRKWSCEPFEGGVEYVRELAAEIQEQALLLGKSAERELALRGEVERLRAAVQHIQNAPMVVDGGSIQWCRVVAQKALEKTS